MARSGEKSTNFELACSLLSQYIKEKGCVADLGLGVAARPREVAKGNSGAMWRPTTMSLLPGADVAGSGRETRDGGEGSRGGSAMELFPQRAGFGPAEETRKSSNAREQEKSQLTIFYGGKVLVFDNFPAEKAKDLMQFAGKSTTNAQSFDYVPSPTTAPAAETKVVTEPVNAAANPVSTVVAAQSDAQKLRQPNVSNIPIAPRNSLQRFLEKRKHRINAAAPYQTSGSPSSDAKPGKPEEHKSWLGLAPKAASPPSLNLNSDCSR